MVTRRAGVTLVELIVALVIIGLVAGVAGLAMRRMPTRAPADDAATAVAAARARALATARAVTVTIQVSGHPHSVTALPDGRVLADAAIAVDPLTGRVARAAR